MKFQHKHKPLYRKLQRCNLQFSFKKDFLEAHKYGSLKTSVYMIDGVRWWLTVYLNYRDEICFSISCHCNNRVFSHLKVSLMTPMRRAQVSFQFKKGFSESRLSPLISRDNLFKYYFRNGNNYVNIRFDGYIVSFG
uniref:MATH domain-containing protein n=1 Tax=Panagrolaimus sp. PS1159 TaxID=55785 RepID=A0AC35F5G0_9BILA